MTQTSDASSLPALSIRGAIVAGVSGLALLMGTLGTWSATTRISGAVVAPGRIVVEGRNKTVQHRDGGIIADIAVENGDPVRKGQVMIRLDHTEIAAALKIARDQRAAGAARQLRLQAESTGRRTIAFATSEEVMFAELTAQTEILTARHDVLRNGRDRLEQTFHRITAALAGIEAQRAALVEEIGYLDEELATTEPLLARKLVSRDRVSLAQRSRAELRGRLARLDTDVSRLEAERHNAILETERMERSFHEGVVTELQEVTAEIGELDIRIATLTAQLGRIDIRAPSNGIVHELQVKTIGGVVTPGQTLLEIVPQDRSAAVEVQIPPDKIDNVRVGQKAELLLAGFDPQTTPKFTGTVQKVSASAIPDPNTGREFFRVEVDLDPAALQEAQLVPVPGMPVETYLVTGDRTVLSYLAEPITGHIRRAFRE